MHPSYLSEEIDGKDHERRHARGDIKEDIDHHGNQLRQQVSQCVLIQKQNGKRT